jgi:hypothetical protein
MVKLIDKITEKIFSAFLMSALAFVISAFCVQMFFVYLQFSGQEEYQRRVINKIEWKFDGRFKDNPENIMYEKPE